jgi:hypothetical protein
MNNRASLVAFMALPRLASVLVTRGLHRPMGVALTAASRSRLTVSRTRGLSTMTNYHAFLTLNCSRNATQKEVKEVLHTTTHRSLSLVSCLLSLAPCPLSLAFAPRHLRFYDLTLPS